MQCFLNDQRKNSDKRTKKNIETFAQGFIYKISHNLYVSRKMVVEDSRWH